MADDGAVLRAMQVSIDGLRDEIAWLRAGLTSIQAHGMLDDNAASMVWTARVALNPDALRDVPEKLREVVSQRFMEVA